MKKYAKRSTAAKNKLQDTFKDDLGEKVMRWPMEWDADLDADLEVITEGDRASVYGDLGADGKPSASQLEAMRRVTPKTPSDQAFHEANEVMLAGEHEAALARFADVAEQHPDKRAAALLSMGACCFWLKRYDEAISHYMDAGDAGAPEEMVASNIDEAQEAKDKG